MGNAPYRLLTRHFLRGFFENDLLSPDQGMEATLAPLLAAIAAPGLLLPMMWSFSYGWPYRRVETFQALAMRHEVLLVMYPMVIVALVTVLQWDSLYPDRRDAEVLGRLPVPTATLFWAKATALLLFVGLFGVASNGAASLVYPIVANIRPQPGSPGPLATCVAHLTATGGAAVFAVFVVLAGMGVMQLVLPARLRRTLSPLVQLASVLVLVLALLMLPFLMMAVDPHNQGGLAEKVALHRLYVEEGGSEAFDWADVPATSSFEADPVHGGMRPRPGKPPVAYERVRDPFSGRGAAHVLADGVSGGAPWVFWFPPVWFLGWYEQLAGRGSAAARLLMGRAQAGIAVTAALAVVCYLWTYRRHAAGAVVGDGAGQRRLCSEGRTRRVAESIQRRVVPHPVARAYFAFVAMTLARSAKHRLIVAAAVGAALAFVLAEAAVGIERIEPARPGPQILSAQFVFTMLLLSGMRMAFAVPAMLPANWAFRFHGPDGVVHCAAGARRAMVVCGLIPVLALLFPAYALLYGVQTAVLHAACGFLASLVLIEALMAGFPKVPFAAPYVPGRAMVMSRLTLYIFAFQFFGYTIAWVESLALPRPGWMLLILGVFAVWYTVAVWRRRTRDAAASLVFDQDAPDGLQTLDLAGPPRGVRP
jgi:hypothetical protein